MEGKMVGRMKVIVNLVKNTYRFQRSPVNNTKRLAERCAEEWRYEYPPGTPLEFIRDEILECWKRQQD
tara:strand:+ start:172 stop:375 length:204 start_codon:yes stop_codon:yes gene_type:complete